MHHDKLRMSEAYEVPISSHIEVNIYRSKTFRKNVNKFS